MEKEKEKLLPTFTCVECFHVWQPKKYLEKCPKCQRRDFSLSYRPKIVPIKLTKENYEFRRIMSCEKCTKAWLSPWINKEPIKCKFCGSSKIEAFPPEERRG